MVHAQASGQGANSIIWRAVAVSSAFSPCERQVSTEGEAQGPEWLEEAVAAVAAAVKQAKATPAPRDWSADSHRHLTVL